MVPGAEQWGGELGWIWGKGQLVGRGHGLNRVKVDSKVGIGGYLSR